MIRGDGMRGNGAYLRKCPHIMVETYYTDADINEMEKALEEKLKI